MFAWPKKLRLAGHPVHPMLVAFPIALFAMTAVWQTVSLFDPRWWLFAFWNLVAGLALAVPTAITGLIDFASIPRHSPAENIAIWHLIANSTAILSFGGSLAALGRPAPSTPERLHLALALSAFGLVVLLAGGWLGGHLVYRHGVGVEKEARTPERGPPPP
jgi:uncharacterized membrane protein